MSIAAIAAITASAAIASGLNAASAAPELAVDLTQDAVLIDQSFAGARIVLFGVVSGTELQRAGVDLVAVLKGPEKTILVRRMTRHFGVWAPGPASSVSGAPSFYFIGSTAPLEQVASPDARVAFNLDLSATHAAEQQDDAAIRAAIETANRARGFYKEKIGAVTIGRAGLFQVAIDLPADTPVGEYRAEVRAYRGGAEIGADATELLVRKAGLDRLIYDAAHDRPFLYGLVCVALSLLAGWTAALAFRK